MSGVEVKSLSVSFGKLEVLKHMNLSVPDGEFLVLLGPSGCGKSTLLDSIAGFIDVDEGEVHIGGANVTWEEPNKRGIGMVFQSYALYPRMSVRGNLAFGLKTSGCPSDEIERRIQRVSSLLHIDHLLHRRPSQLSGGQRQRVAIGRALVKDAEVFLFDEPLSNLDAQLRAELRLEIKKIHQTLGNTIIYVTHDQIEALTLADRIAVMYGGVITQLAPPQQIYDKPDNLFVAGFVGSPKMNFHKGALKFRNGVPFFESPEFSLSLANYEFIDKAEDGRPVTIGIRAEQAAISRGSEQETIEGKVSIVEHLGAEQLVWSQIGDFLLVVKAAGDEPVKVGDNVPLHIQTNRISLFDSATEKRL